MKLLLYICIFCTSMTFAVSKDIEQKIDKLKLCQQSLHSCESGSKNVYCSCDRKCVYYDNCCFDAAAIKGGWGKIIEEDQHQHYLQITTCEEISFRKKESLRQGAFMISSCPVSWASDMDTRQACKRYTDSNVRDMLPVVDTSTKLTFKNRQCAKCHSVENYTPWLLKIECLPERQPPSLSITEGVMMKINNDHCSYRFLPPEDVTVHYCYHDFDYRVISDISETDNSSCRNRVFSPVLAVQGKHNRYFRTLECLIAHESTGYLEDLDILTCALLTSSQNEFNSGTMLSNLIDFSSVFQRRETKCKDAEIQLSDEVGCRRLYCPARSEASVGKCVDIQINTDDLILDLLFEVNTDPKTKISVNLSLRKIIDTFLSDLRNITGSNFKYALIIREVYRNLVPGKQFNSEDICSIYDVFLPIKRVTNTGYTLESERLWTANYFKEYILRKTEGKVITHAANVQNMSCKTNVSLSNPLYLLDMFSVDNDLPCPAVKLQYSGNGSESEDQNNSTKKSYFYLHGIIISPFDAVFVNGDYFLCIDTFLSKYRVDYQQNNIMDIYRSYINTACASISIICMIYCLIQYCVIPIFRDGKSDLLTVLLLFLLLAQTFFFLLSHFEIPNYVCEWVGFVHHFTWLGAFVFMFLCPYRFNTEIRDLQTYSRRERTMATFKYMLVGISLPLFVIICIKITNVILAPTEKWYGGRLCFVTETFVVLFGFVVPVFLILCGNAFLFICIIRYISSTSVSANSNKSNAVVFIKISTIMGFSWIIGIVAVMSQSDVLLLIFEILSNLQGAFITVSFSCTNRVRAFYKSCFHRANNQP